MNEKVIINEKLFYRFVEFTSKLQKLDLPHEIYKQICLDNYTPQTKHEKLVKRNADAFRYLINCTSCDVDENLILTSYFILTGRKLSTKNVNYILSKYYHRLDDFPHQKASSLHLDIIDMKVDKKVEYAFLLANYVLIKRGYYPIIVYPNDRELYKDAVKQRKHNPNQFYLFLVQAEHFIRKSHNHKRLLTEEIKNLNEIITILKNESEVLKQRFYVKELYLYGSHVKQSNISTSDIDILVVLDKSVINYEKYEIIKKIKERLYGIMGCRVDVMEFDHALTALEIHEMTHSITII
jgi:uncharacterized protein